MWENVKEKERREKKEERREERLRMCRSEVVLEQDQQIYGLRTLCALRFYAYMVIWLCSSAAVAT